jgi:hypothetical protein
MMLPPRPRIVEPDLLMGASRRYGAQMRQRLLVIWTRRYAATAVRRAEMVWYCSQAKLKSRAKAVPTTVVSAYGITGNSSNASSLNHLSTALSFKLANTLRQ